MKVNWYRNSSELDRDIVHGTGEIVQMVATPENIGHGLAIIVDKDGIFHEKLLNLLKVSNSDITNKLKKTVQSKKD